MSSSRSYGGGGGGGGAQQLQQLQQITKQEMKAFLENPDDPVNLAPFQPHLTLTPKSNVFMNNKMSGALRKVLDSQPDLIIKLLDFNPEQETSKSRIISGARSLVSNLHDPKHTDLLKKLIDTLVKTSYQKQALPLLELMNHNIGRTDELFADAIKDRKIIQKSLKLIDKARKIVKGEIAPDKETVEFLKKIIKARMTPHEGSTPLLPDLSLTRQYKEHVERFIQQYDKPTPKRIIDAVMYLQNKEDTNLKRSPAQYLYRRLFDDSSPTDLGQRRNRHRILTNIEELQERIQRDSDIKRKDIHDFLSDPNYQLTGDLANDDLINLQRKMSRPLHFVLTKEPALIDVILDVLKGKTNRSRRYEILQTMMHILIQDFHDDKIVQYLKKVVPHVFQKLKREKVNAIENPVYRFLDITLNKRNSEELLETALTTQVLDEIRSELHDIENPPSQSQSQKAWTKYTTSKRR